MPIKKESEFAALLKKRQDLLEVIKAGDIIKGTVIGTQDRRVYVEIEGGRFLGIISGQELTEEGLVLPDYRVGDLIVASVVDTENDEGYMLLSVREAVKNQGWDILEEYFKKSQSFPAKVVGANRGGLIVEAEGLRGFLPVSQLAPEHYPRVGTNKDEILTRLSKFENQELEMGIFDLDKKTGKIIFSERAARQGEFAEFTSSIKIGDVLEGKVTGVVDFGIFVNLGTLEGLVHISEISWDKVTSVADFAKVGDKVKVQVIGIEGDKISLSIKRLMRDPWLDLVKDYQIGDIVEGEVTQIMPFGVFVRVDNKIDGLIHISELSHKHIKEPGEVVTVGDRVKAKIVNIGPENRRFGLSLKALEEAEEMSKTEALASLGLSKAIVAKLSKAGILDPASLKGKRPDELMAIEGIGQASAEKILEAINKLA
jgi:small subunit ribosomal protein S1